MVAPIHSIRFWLIGLSQNLYPLGVSVTRRIPVITINATNRGIIIVSANSNENVISYPANLKNVIGIFNAVNKEFYCDEEMSNLYLQNIQYYKGQKLEGTSYIVPHIVGTICQQIRKSKKISIEEIFKIYLENFRLIK